MKMLSGSCRARSAEDTLLAVLPFSKRFGVSRVTDITHLDRIGIPVFASIRPSAAKGIVRVHNGKGTSRPEAKVGAIMEAYEFQIAEFGGNNSVLTNVTPKQMEESFVVPVRFSDFCIRFGELVNYEERLHCVEAEEILSNQPVMVPAELVYLPYRAHNHRSIFGSSTNGLASGNSLVEASIHAACEIIERDVRSSLSVDETSQRVNPNGWPKQLEMLRLRIESAGLKLYLRYAKSPIGLPFFKAYITELSICAPTAIAVGYGLHPDITIAASRAITEAAQSRLTYIHGGRDDIIERFDLLKGKPSDFEAKLNKKILENISCKNKVVRFSEMSTSIRFDSLDSCWSDICKLLQAHGFEHIIRIDLSPADIPFSVVRIVIPKMEYYNSELQRIGPRLSDLIAKTSTERQ